MTEGMNIFLIIIINTLYIFCFLKKSKSWLICIVGFIIYMVSCMGLELIFVNYPLLMPQKQWCITYNIAINLLWFIYIYIVFEEPLSFKWLTAASIWLVTMTFIYISSILVNFFPHVAILKRLTIFISTVIEGICLYFLVTFYRKQYRNALYSTPRRTIYLLSVFPFLGFLIIKYNYHFKSLNIFAFHEFYSSLIMLVYIIWGYILGIIAIVTVKEAVELKKNVEILTIQLQLQEENYKLINKSIEQTRAFEHDLRHHISTMKAMLSKNNIDGTLDYIEKLDNSKIDNLPIICKNFTIDSLLKYFMSRCRNSNIDFKIKVNVPEKIKVDDLDLSIVLGNCIENAIEACEKLEPSTQRFIMLASGIFGDNLVFKIKNNFNGKIAKTGEHIQSSKGNRIGIGISNVKQIVDKYNGNFKMEYTDSLFEVCIIL